MPRALSAIWAEFAYGFRHYRDFTGRANRREFWSASAVTSALIFLALLIDVALGSPLILFLVTVIVLFMPSFAVAARRLQDVGAPGVLLALNFVPFGGLVLLVMYLIKGNDGPNKYGPPPPPRRADETLRNPDPLHQDPVHNTF